MKCEEQHIAEVNCSSHGKVRKSQTDNVLRCPNHYRLKTYGYCIENHEPKVLATGHHKRCNRCQYDQNKNKSQVRNKNLIGTKNIFGLEYTSGPYRQYGKNKNATAWGMQCIFCNNEFVAIAYQAKKAKSCYECRGEHRKTISEESTYKHLYSGVKGRKHAKYGGFDLTLEEFIEIVQQNCYYCNAEPAASKGHREWSAYVRANGIDRVDSSKGYTKDNIVPCCRTCNSAKGTLSRKEFLAWALQLVNHQQCK